MTDNALFLLIAGAATGGFVNGLAGFGTALFALGFWLRAFDPVEAVALVMVVSALTGLQGLWVIRDQIWPGRIRILRFLLPALIGVPLGLLALSQVNPRALNLLIAALMLLYGCYFILRRRLPQFDRPTPLADMGIGFAGGLMGGLAGLSGALPAMWCGLRPWPRHETRALLQCFNFTILSLGALILALRGTYDAGDGRALLIAVATAALSARMGIALFKRLSDGQFRWFLIALMVGAGALLLARTLTET